MGRGIRSNEDYCVVILMGSQLLRALYASGAVKHFSPATKRQLELSRDVSSQIAKMGLAAMAEPISDVLRRNPEWVAAAKNRLIGVAYPPIQIDEVSVAQRQAYEFLRQNRHEDAAVRLQDASDKAGDRYVSGWLLDQAAEALHPVDRVRSQTMLLGAYSRNFNVTKPLAGISYRKMEASKQDQARQASAYLLATYRDGGNAFLLAVKAILDDLSFREGDFDEFEQALYELGLHLGFNSQRPEKDGGGKLDVLWGIGAHRYVILPCKSGSVSDAISKQYADQISGNLNWFKATYGRDCQGVPVMVHPATGRSRCSAACRHESDWSQRTCVS